MTDRISAPITGLKTGVPGLDAILGGDLPEYSFNMIAGPPGAGKTTLAQQVMFANATVERPALYFTVLGEPTLKMIRYQQAFDFFRPELVGSAIKFINLSHEVLAGDLDVVLERVTDEVNRAAPGIVVVDSFRTISRPPEAQSSAGLPLEHFVQKLALHLTTWEVTSFLLGEYESREQRNPVFTVADGILWLSQSVDRNSVVRKLQALKVRGRAPMPGLHTFRITGNGLQVFPRIPQEMTLPRPFKPHGMRLSTGVPGFDEMTGGGIPAGDAVIMAGPAGSGKTTFARQFVAAGLRNGESAVVAVFEEKPEGYLSRADIPDPVLRAKVEDGKLKLVYLRPLDLSVDEMLMEILDNVRAMDAKRVVIDSLTGFEVALAPTFREDFRESLYRLVGSLTAVGVTVFMTSEVSATFHIAPFTDEKVSFITDDIFVQRYVELEGEIRTVVAAVKMRGSNHSHAMRLYHIDDKGAAIDESLRDYSGIVNGQPILRSANSGD